jgi:hypothetical protein
MALALDGVERVLDRESDQIATRIGGDPAATRQAISLALPALLAGLQQEAATPGTGLQQAVRQDHDGSILDDIAGYLNGTSSAGPRTTNGEGILEHVLGSRRPGVQQALSSQTGLSTSSIAQLLPLLAPIVMGMLGRQSRSQPQGGDLGSILGGLLGGGSGSASGGLADVLNSVLGGRPQR